VFTASRRRPVRTAAAAWLALALLALPAGCARNEPNGAPSPGAAPATSATAPAAARSTPAPTTTAAEPPSPAPRPTAPSARPSPTTGVPAAFAGREVTLIPTSRNVVALTFDAGANADAVPSILDTLARERVRATFFLTGDFVDRYPAASRSIVAAGHRLGNHSVDHPHFPTLTAAELRAEVVGAQRTIAATTGADSRPFFRFPYGDRTAATVSAVNGLGYVAVRWTVDSLGWQGIAAQSVGSVTARVLGAARPGEIVLMHVGSHPTDRSMLDADALPGVIAGLRQRGYAFVTLDALVGGTG
jgi:peptidoglycan/xylan/chitin deacetylase (PgdA/CDA1 family)